MSTETGSGKMVSRIRTLDCIEKEKLMKIRTTIKGGRKRPG